MSSVLLTEVKLKCYLDSVALMRHSKVLAGMPGVVEAAMMMGTPANLEIMQNAQLLDANVEAGSADLIISVSAMTDQNAQNAMREANALLDAPVVSQGSDAWQPRSLRSAVQLQNDANLALISVPGAFAIAEARKAIKQGLHAMIFSDNVPLEQEVELKQEARSLGKLVMGPDCGTAIINGVPLAFANKITRGPVGIIGASGTGIQEVSCLLSGRGIGISHALGVGGRDLHESVGGISTLMAMDFLEHNSATEHIVLISKPPAPSVMQAVLEKIKASTKNFTVCFLGGEKPQLSDNCHWAHTLSGAAEAVCNAFADKKLPALSSNTSSDKVPPGIKKGRFISGLFCGGTLCTEACVLFKKAAVPYRSNISVGRSNNNTSDDPENSLLDLGADEYTQGKPHPMIEPAIRDDQVGGVLADATVGVLLVDMVIGYGAHPNPADGFINAIQSFQAPSAQQHDVLVIASVTGTDEDPQSRSRQIQLLENAGVVVASSNAAAVQLAISAIDDTV